MSKSTLARTDSGEIQLTITIPKNEVKEAYEVALEKITKEAVIPGFRKGKAPKTLVEQKTDKAALYEKVLQEIVPQAYEQTIKEHQLKPVISPKIQLLKAREGEDWEFRATTCERPKVQLGNYKEKIKKALAPTKLWTPDKGKSQKEAEKPTLEEKTQKVMQTLLEEVKVLLPKILVEEEVNRALSNLINQTNSLGMTIDQYLASIGKSGDQIREEYRQKVEQDLKLQLALDEIARKEKIEAKEEEIDELIRASGDEKFRKNLNTPLQRAYIKGVIGRRKTLDFLAKL